MKSEDSKLKILFLAKYLNLSGVTTFMLSLGKELIKHGFSVGIAFGENSPYDPENFKNAGFYIFEIPFIGMGYGFANFTRSIISIPKFLKIVREFKPDIIHVHWRVTSLYAEIASRIWDIPYIVTLHLEGIPSSYMAKLLSFWGEYAIAISTETYNYLHSKFNLPSGRIKLVYNGVDDTYFRPPSEKERNDARERFGIPKDAKVVSFIGRLVKTKGYDILIKSASLLKNQGITPYFLMAGSGNSSDVLTLAKSFGVEDSFILTGFVDSREVLWASDLLVLPSRIEGFPLVIIEAMFCGVVPIRTPAAGAYDQITNGIDGFIIPFEDHIALAEKIKVLLENENLRRKMSEKALEKAKKLFSLEQMCNKYIEIYKEVLSKR